MHIHSLANCTASSAADTILGPRLDPPMPMLTISVMALPVQPFHSPERTRYGKSRRIFPSTRVDFRHDIMPIHINRAVAPVS